MNRGLLLKFYKVKYAIILESLEWHDLLLRAYNRRRLSRVFRKKTLENDMVGYRRVLILLTKTKKMHDIINQMIKCFQLRGRDNSEYEQQYLKLLRQAEELDADILSLLRWKDMEGAAIHLGLFSLGLSFRNKAIEKVKIHQDEKKYKYQRFLIALEERDYSYANELLTEMENAKESKYLSGQPEIARQYLSGKLEIARQFLCVMCNDEKYFEMKYKQLAIEDKDFYDAVKREDFILFGPVYEDLSAHHVQDDTRMIRINYTGESTLGEAVKYKNVWMSYYRDVNRIKQFEGDNAKKEFESVEYIINFNDKVPKIYHDKKVRVANDVTSIHFEGFNYVLPVVLFDLAKMGRRRIKVSGVNLYHGVFHDKSYHKVMRGTEEMDKTLIPYTFFIHGIITHFIMIKNMRDAGVIEPTGVLSEILDLSLEQYIKDLEEIYVM